jgi:nucleoside-diphosphate kinase
MKMLHMNISQAQSFYAIHMERPFFNDLVDFMTSGPAVVMILNHADAVNSFRKLIGATDPLKAEEGTVRKKFATSVQMNAVHGSDSDENAAREADFFFSGIERFF